MTAALQRYSTYALLLLTALFGLALGQMAATLLGIRLLPSSASGRTTAAVAAGGTSAAQLHDYEIVVQRNLFDASRPNVLSLTTPTASAPAARASFSVLGTITAGPASLALIRTDKETKPYRLGSEAPGGGRIVAITRTAVQIRRADGSEETVLLKDAPRLGPVATGAASASSVRAAGDNRYVIPRQEAEKARSNINELLKQARLEPNIVDGQTRGFAVKMIRSDSILASLGLQLGDVVMQVNGVPLDSPEKALQIFQQLREARHISLALERGGSPMSLEYDLD